LPPKLKGGGIVGASGGSRGAIGAIAPLTCWKKVTIVFRFYRDRLNEQIKVIRFFTDEINSVQFIQIKHNIYIYAIHNIYIYAIHNIYIYAILNIYIYAIQYKSNKCLIKDTGEN